jgi:8-oxo-dGTP pyrophosphatase MutT (NUDIX family)
MTKMKIRTAVGAQYAALPYRMRQDGSCEVMLVTSRETRRWIIPKGWLIKGLKPSAVAAREAFEEAGLIGEIGKHPVGHFRYEKTLPKNSRICEVRVFLLRVKRQLNDWPEKRQRETRWFEPGEAAGLVEEDGLAMIIRQAIPNATEPLAT